MKRLAVAAFCAITASIPAHADDAHHAKSPSAASGAAQVADAMSEGEVRKVDKEVKKITIKHGPLADLDMPAMTMVFQVKEPSMLDKVKVGDRVKFIAEKVDGQFMVTRIEVAN